MQGPCVLCLLVQGIRRRDSQFLYAFDYGTDCSSNSAAASTCSNTSSGMSSSPVDAIHTRPPTASLAGDCLDYSSSKGRPVCNQHAYGQQLPPFYNLSTITTPLALFSGEHGLLSSLEASPKWVRIGILLLTALHAHNLHSSLDTSVLLLCWQFRLNNTAAAVPAAVHVAVQAGVTPSPPCLTLSSSSSSCSQECCSFTSTSQIMDTWTLSWGQTRQRCCTQQYCNLLANSAGGPDGPLS